MSHTKDLSHIIFTKQYKLRGWAWAQSQAPQEKKGEKVRNQIFRLGSVAHTSNSSTEKAQAGEIRSSGPSLAKQWT